MPYTPNDARDLLISATLCDDPVVYIDDRWLYEQQEEAKPIQIYSLSKEAQKCIHEGTDITLVGSGYTSLLCKNVCEKLKDIISCDVFDLRILNPMNLQPVFESVKKTGRLLVVDGGWSSCGVASEVIAWVVEHLRDVTVLKCAPQRITLKNAPAPTSGYLEQIYYPNVEDVCKTILDMVKI